MALTKIKEIDIIILSYIDDEYLLYEICKRNKYLKLLYEDNKLWLLKLTYDFKYLFLLHISYNKYSSSIYDKIII